jgi:serine phosphatase RsbU (regulator of sigma subunit)
MLLFLSSDAGERWPLDPPLVTIGRSPSSSICIPDVSVSRQHAEIEQREGHWFLRDLGSSNGTRLNGTAVQASTRIAPGDTVRFGNVLRHVISDQLGSQVTLTETSLLGATLKLPPEQILEHRTRTVEGAQQLVHLLAEAGRQLVLPQSLEDTYDEMLRFVEKAVPASRYILLIKPGRGEELVPVAGRACAGLAGEPLVLSKAILRTVVEENSAVLTRNAVFDPRLKGSDSLLAQGVRSAVAVPLYDEERLHGILYVDSQDPRVQLGEDQLELLTLLGDMAAVKISNTRLLKEEQAGALMRQQLGMAARIQRGLLQAETPTLDGYEIEAVLQPCYEVGGDLYDFHSCPDGGLVFVLGDVSGKGLGAALLMSLFLASLRVLCDYCSELEELATQLSARVYRTTDPMTYVTGFIGCLTPATGTLKYVNAGHPAPLLARGGELRALESTGMPFGILPDQTFTAAEVTLQPGELLAVFSDGVTEASRAGRFFEESRLRDVLREVAREEPLAQARAAIIRRVDEFLDGAPRSDDLALVLIRRAGRPVLASD